MNILMNRNDEKRIICLQYGFISSVGLFDALKIWSREDVKVETPFQTH